jgi:hypothetical protein
MASSTGVQVRKVHDGIGANHAQSDRIDNRISRETSKKEEICDISEYNR